MVVTLKVLSLVCPDVLDRCLVQTILSNLKGDRSGGHYCGQPGTFTESPNAHLKKEESQFVIHVNV
jgi:hypothetical protein